MKNWYVLAYDIREPKRLRRTHYFLSKKALSLQNSVFLIQANSHDLSLLLLDEVRQRVNDQIDDVRLYPISHPTGIWAAGKQADALSHLYMAVQNKPSKPGRRHLLGRLFNRLTGL